MTTAFLTHVTASDERWDHIAYHYYGDPCRRADLIRANAGILFALLDPIPPVLPPNTVVRIPVLPVAVSPQNLPPWKRSG